MSPYISGFLIFLIISLFLGAFFSLLYTDKLKLNDESLDKQPLFWFAVLSPIALFLIFGVVIWKDYIPDLSKAGLNKFAEISKFPLAILALSPIFGVIVSNIHRTIQTKKQIQVTEVKNISDGFYAHNKFILEEFKSITEKNDGNNIELSIISPNILYKKIYDKSTLSNGANNNVSTEFLAELERNIISLNNELINSNKEVRRLYIDSDSVFANIQVNLGGFIQTLKKTINHLCINNKNNRLEYYLLTRPADIKIKIEKELSEIMEKYPSDNRIIHHCESCKVHLFLSELFSYLGLLLYIVEKLLDIINIKKMHALSNLENETSREFFNLLVSLRQKMKSQEVFINLIYIC